MSTTFIVAIARRPLTENMFADLGYPSCTITPVQLTAHNMSYEFTVPETLTTAQILRARIRAGSRQVEHENLMIAMFNATKDLDDYLAIPAPTNAQAVAMVKTLAQDVRGLLRWVGKDAMGL